jgi:surface antigen
VFGRFSLSFRRLSRRCLLSAAVALAIATGALLPAPVTAYASAGVAEDTGVIDDGPGMPDPALTAATDFSSAGSAVVSSQATAARGVRVTSKRKASRRNNFYYGQCTWWVAQKRYVPWHGNAWAWWWHARRYGFREGRKPRAGAIMVMGRSWSTPYGHVAYVLRVNHDGSFLISEMNWWGVRGGGWNRIDHRRIKSMRGVLGFIY